MVDSVDRYTSHVFSHAPCTCDHTHIVAQGVSVRISPHPHAIHDVTCLNVRLLSLRFRLFPVSLPLLPCLFHCLLVLCPAHHLQCRHRRGLKTLHSRRKRSIAPWRYTYPLTDSAEELKSPRSVSGKNFPIFEMLDANIASALNKIIKIIQNSQFKKKVKSQGTEWTGFYESDRSPS